MAEGSACPHRTPTGLRWSMRTLSQGSPGDWGCYVRTFGDVAWRGEYVPTLPGDDWHPVSCHWEVPPTGWELKKESHGTWTHWPLGDLAVILKYNFQTHYTEQHGTSCQIALRWKPQNLINERSTLVQIKAWCCKATSCCLCQWWPTSMSSYGVTRPQWVNPLCANLFWGT